MFSCLISIFFGTAPRREFGRSMTSRGGESSALTSGITGLLERISTAGTPRSCTMRTLLTSGGGPNVCAAAEASSNDVISVIQANLSTRCRNKSLIGSLRETYHLQGNERSRTDLGRQTSDCRPRTADLRRPASPSRNYGQAEIELKWSKTLSLTSEARCPTSRFWQEFVFLDHGRHGELAVVPSVFDSHNTTFALHADAFRESDLRRKRQSKSDGRSLCHSGVEIEADAPRAHVTKLDGLSFVLARFNGDGYAKREASGCTLLLLRLSHAFPPKWLEVTVDCPTELV